MIGRLEAVLVEREGVRRAGEEQREAQLRKARAFQDVQLALADKRDRLVLVFNFHLERAGGDGHQCVPEIHAVH